ncbi:MAG: metallophosphoesterase family protein [Anaerolineales bacterium]|jgi:predicted phosphodiesterase
MSILVISDIHANLSALQEVLQAAGKVDAVWCLGDVIGYGPKPNECIELIREQPGIVCLLGNHDAACIGQLNVATFNREARIAVEWTQSVLTRENIEFLQARPQIEVIDNVTLAHGSPREPVYEYILDVRSARENFDYFDNDYCFIGHSHLPLLFVRNSAEDKVSLSFPQQDHVIHLKPRSIVNPGSVGQPRDRDRRASYAIYDPKNQTWTHHRVEYDIQATQEDMRVANLPSRHIDRLNGGW